MSPSPMIGNSAPEVYNKHYCETVHTLCSEKIIAVGEKVSDVHAAIFGSVNKPGIVDTLNRKMSISTLKWAIGVFAIPAILALFAGYEFYVAAPLKYAEHELVARHTAQIARIEERAQELKASIEKLPTTEQVKAIILDAVRYKDLKDRDATHTHAPSK